MVEEARDISNKKTLTLINLKFREKGIEGDFKYQNLLIKLKHLISTVR